MVKITTTANMLPNAYYQLTSLSSAVSVPGTGRIVMLAPETQAVRIRDDGVDPTTTVGFLIPAGTTLRYSGNPQALRVIEAASGATLNVTAYGGTRQRVVNTGFNPNLITGLRQYLFGAVTPTSGTITDERTGFGTDRMQEPGRAYLLDGVNDFVRYGAGVGEILGDASASFWVNVTAHKAFYYLFSYGAAGETEVANILHGMFVTTDGSVGYLHEFGPGTNQRYDSTGIDLVLGTWAHLAVVRDDSAKTVRMYKDGVYVETYTYTTSPTGGSTSLLELGASAGTSSQILDGKLFDFRLYNSTKTDAEILAMYSFETDQSNIVVHAKCDDNHVTVAYDSSGNISDGAKLNITAGTFHYEGNDVPYSYQNQVGFTDDSGDLVPRDESDTANDVAGNPLTYTGETPMKATLVNSMAATFDGLNDYIDASSGFLPDPTDAWEVEFYVNVTAAVSKRFVAWANSSDDVPMYSIGTGAVGTKLRLFFQNDAAGTFDQTSTATVADNTEHHIRVNHDGAGNVKAYIDGVLDIDSSYTTAALAVDTLAIGCLVRAANSAFVTGSMYDVKIYSGIDGANPEHHYPLAEGGGTIAYDAVGGTIGRIGGITEASFWGTTQDTYHANLLNGFDSVGNFDGIDDTATVPYDASLHIKGDLSISFWMKVEAIPPTTIYFVAHIASGETEATNASYGLHMGNGTITYVHEYGAGLDETDTFGVITTDVVYHIAMVRDDTAKTVKVYVDGVQSGTTFTYTNSATGGESGSLVFGGFFTSLWLNGQMRDLRIYNDTLTDDERAFIRTGSGTDPGSGNLQGHWTIAEGTGTTGYDQSANGNDATFNAITESSFWVKTPAKADGTSSFTALAPSHRAGPWHNGAETQIDFTGDVLAPGTAAWETAWSFATARTNPLFRRKTTLSGSDLQADRFLAYDVTLSGADLTNIQSFTQDRGT